MDFDAALRRAYAGAYPEVVSAPAGRDWAPPATVDVPVFENVHLADVLRRVAGGAYAGLTDRVLVRGAFELARRARVHVNLSSALADLEADWCAAVSPDQEREWRVTPASWDTHVQRARWSKSAPGVPRPELVCRVRLLGPDSGVRRYTEICTRAKRTSAEWAYALGMREMLAQLGDDVQTLEQFVVSTASAFVEGLASEHRDVDSHALKTWRAFASEFELVPGASKNAARAASVAGGRRELITPEEFAGAANADAARETFYDAAVLHPYARSRARWRECFELAPEPAGAGRGRNESVTMSVFVRELIGTTLREERRKAEADEDQAKADVQNAANALQAQLDAAKVSTLGETDAQALLEFEAAVQPWLDNALDDDAADAAAGAELIDDLAEAFTELAKADHEIALVVVKWRKARAVLQKTRDVDANPVSRDEILKSMPHLLRHAPEFAKFEQWHETTALSYTADMAAHSALTRVVGQKEAWSSDGLKLVRPATPGVEFEMRACLDTVRRFAAATTDFERWLAQFRDDRVHEVMEGLVGVVEEQAKNANERAISDAARAWFNSGQYPELCEALQIVRGRPPLASASDALMREGWRVWKDQNDLTRDVRSILRDARDARDFIRRLAATAVVWCGPPAAGAGDFLASLSVKVYEPGDGARAELAVAAVVRGGEPADVFTRRMLACVRDPRDYAAYLTRGTEGSLSDAVVELRERALDRAQSRVTEYGNERRDMEEFARALRGVDPAAWYEWCRVADDRSARTTAACVAARDAHFRFLTLFDTVWTQDVQVVRECSFLARRGKWLIELRREEQAARERESAFVRTRATERIQTNLQQWLARSRFDDAPLTPQVPDGVRVLGFERRKHPGGSGNWAARTDVGTGRVVVAPARDESVWPVLIADDVPAADLEKRKQQIAAMVQPDNGPVAALSGCWALKARLCRELLISISVYDNDARTAAVSRLCEQMYGVIPSEKSVLFQSLAESHAFLVDATTGLPTGFPARIGELAGPAAEPGVPGALPPPAAAALPAPGAGYGAAVVVFMQQLRDQKLVAPDVPAAAKHGVDIVVPRASLVLPEGSRTVACAETDSSDPAFVSDVPAGEVPHDWCEEANRYLSTRDDLVDWAQAKTAVALFMKSVEEQLGTSGVAPPARFDPEPYTLRPKAPEPEPQPEPDAEVQAGPPKKKKKKMQPKS